MLQMGNIVKNPRIWIPPTLASAVTGPIATCLFRLEMNGDPINAGMGTCGLCGQIGVWTGWLAPSERALAEGAAAISPTALHWAGLILVCFILPAVLFIGVTTFVLSAVGVKAGSVFGARYRSRAELAGGLVLIGMGIKILLEHTLFA